jgi:DNA repair protein RecN (Recombination protein N)
MGQDLISLIKKLHVQNILLLENLVIEFKPGLNVLTGETGAGKSILLDCLGYLFGKKNTRLELDNNADNANIIGEFQVNKNSDVGKFLEEKGLLIKDTVFLRQNISPSNKRRAYINDIPCSLDLVRELGDLMLDLNGQFEEQGLLNVKTHRGLLDLYGNLQGDLNKLEKAWTAIAHLKKKLEAEYEKQSLGENSDFLTNSIKEIIELRLDKSELEFIEERRDQLKKTSRLNAEILSAFQNLNREMVEESLISTIRSLERLDKKADIGDLLPIEAFNMALDKFSQASDTLSLLSERSINSESELNEIENRYHAIKRICRAHNVELKQILNLQTILEKELISIENTEKRVKEIEKEILTLTDQYKKDAAFLSKQRHKYAYELDKKVEKELKPLKLELTKFKTDLTTIKESRSGFDHVCFTTEINPGTGFKPINKVASGGELSRFLLAVKLCFLYENNNKSQIFDEIDRGVGGATASAIGKRLLELSKHEQVLVVTHSPQVAAYSDNHLKVEKISTGESTNTKVETLNEEKTVGEIARMLSGELVSSEALAAALSLRKSSKKVN